MRCGSGSGRGVSVLGTARNRWATDLYGVDAPTAAGGHPPTRPLLAVRGSRPPTRSPSCASPSRPSPTPSATQTPARPRSP
ncbi:hypothetical protein GTW46_40470 [Streptomyces sp. SID6013]|nr:hypothetical protein [Streptomyces sp. SID6013]